MSTVDSAVDSTDVTSDRTSQVSSTTQLEKKKKKKIKRKRNPHLTLAQMRGVVQVFRHRFPSKTGKRMSKEEHNKRWAGYKAKIYRDYNRAVTGKFSSEKALIKRYSCPLRFEFY